MQLVGNSSDKQLVKVLFNSPEEFNVEISKHKNQRNFYFKKHLTIVSWDDEKEIYEFYVS